MAIPKSKVELLSAINQNFEKLENVLDAVPANLENIQLLDGHAKGTQMSINNLISYLIGWNELVLKWLTEDDAGKEVQFPDVGYQWNELGKLAQKFYQDYEKNSFETNRKKLIVAKDAIVAEIMKRSDRELYGNAWHRKYTKGRMIQFNSSSPYENARSRIHKWLQSIG